MYIFCALINATHRASLCRKIIHSSLGQNYVNRIGIFNPPSTPPKCLPLSHSNKIVESSNLVRCALVLPIIQSRELPVNVRYSGIYKGLRLVVRNLPTTRQHRNMSVDLLHFYKHVTTGTPPPTDSTSLDKTVGKIEELLSDSAMIILIRLGETSNIFFQPSCT